MGHKTMVDLPMDLIRPDASKDWLAIGWFTPNYKPLAEQFANNLFVHGAPYHLFARDKRAGGWDTRQKPSVVLDAMDRYPGKTLVLMDVDCIVKGDVAPVIDIAGDVGLTIKARQTRKGLAWQKRIAFVAGSRVTVWKPTPGARVFATEWQRLCDQAPTGGDETWLAWAYLRCPEIAKSHVDTRYSAQEVSKDQELPDVVILHRSAHGEQDKNSIREALKRFERRWLRTGRTKRETRLRMG